MLIPNHPENERLSAIASADVDAIGDGELTSHVAGCARCTQTVAELRGLRASLADLPDLRPPRPLQFLPAVDADASARGSADPLTLWVRRLFAPVMSVGATLALVGLVGTAAPFAGGSAAIFQDVGNTLEAGGDEAPAAEGAAAEPLATTDSGGAAAMDGDDTESAPAGAAEQRDHAGDSEALTGLPTDRPLWPVLLFSGVALVLFALLLRWIILPRAG